MNDPYGLSKASIPIAYAQLLLEIVAERGIAAEQLLRESKLPVQLFAVPEADSRITPRQWSRLVWSAIVLTGDESLGCEYGLRLRPTAHGNLGFALMSCSTVGQALELGAMFFRMRLRDYQMLLRTEDDVAIMEITETHPVIGAAPEQAILLRRFFHECVMLGIVHGGRYLTGKDFSGVELWLDWAEPVSYSRYRDRLPPIRFNQATCQVRTAAIHMQLPLMLGDPIAHQQALAQCEQERVRNLDAITTLISRVKAELILTPEKGYPSLDAVAEKLHLSGRTLKRHLQALDTTYLSLLDETRRQEAEKLLTTTEMDIQSISSLLGYVGPANFTRAFKKWTGMTPSQFRGEMGRI
ncbi:AraC family transcriptional regulator ligand-binding domain-containing protein [Aquirhabdus sp.]|uniref:AraC family transcriptional regulator n=1 Tax=Aquirhabdus sp. TaxID=2824160 RepID=UPI00396CBE17